MNIAPGRCIYSKDMTAGWNKGKRPLSEEHKRKISLALKGIKRLKGFKRSEEDKLKIRLGRQNSVKWQMRLERSRLKKELKQQRSRLNKELRQQARDEKKRQLETARLQKIALRIYFHSLKVEPSFSHTTTEGLRRISEARKGRTPWNKGVEAWNRNRPWPIEVRENISRGMIAYWMQRKEEAEGKTQIG